MFFFLVAVGAGTVVLCIIVIIGLCCYVKRIVEIKIKFIIEFNFF